MMAEFGTGEGSGQEMLSGENFNDWLRKQMDWDVSKRNL